MKPRICKPVCVDVAVRCHVQARQHEWDWAGSMLSECLVVSDSNHHAVILSRSAVFELPDRHVTYSTRPSPTPGHNQHADQEIAESQLVVLPLKHLRGHFCHILEDSLKALVLEDDLHNFTEPCRIICELFRPVHLVRSIFSSENSIGPVNIFEELCGGLPLDD